VDEEKKRGWDDMNDDDMMIIIFVVVVVVVVARFHAVFCLDSTRCTCDLRFIIGSMSKKARQQEPMSVAK